jgi:hypothetical protein
MLTLFLSMWLDPLRLLFRLTLLRLSLLPP